MGGSPGFGDHRGGTIKTSPRGGEEQGVLREARGKCWRGHVPKRGQSKIKTASEGPGGATGGAEGGGLGPAPSSLSIRGPRPPLHRHSPRQAIITGYRLPVPHVGLRGDVQGRPPPWRHSYRELTSSGGTRARRARARVTLAWMLSLCLAPCLGGDLGPVT